MKTWVRRSLNVGALTAGALLASGAAAHAHPSMASTDNIGLLNGTQALVPIQAPVNLCGNAVGVLGAAQAGCHGGSAASLDDEWSFHHFQQATGGNIGAGNGTQVAAPIQVPVNACGNAVGVLGAAQAGCEGGADTGRRNGGGKDYGYGHGYESEHGSYGSSDGSSHGSSHGYDDPSYGSSPSPTMLTSGNVGVLNGTQALVPVQVPINICGNAISLLGSAQAGCEGGAKAR